MKRYQLLWYFAIIFILVSFISRIVLMGYSMEFINTNLFELLKLFLVGFFYDIVAYYYYIIPFVIYLLFIPSSVFNTKIHKAIALAVFFFVLFLVVFSAFSEWFFWEEFGKRFNFIAVDYLVYTHEVIHNIQESYPLPLLVGIVFFITLILFLLLLIKSDILSSVFEDESTIKQRMVVSMISLVMPFIFFNGLHKQDLSCLVSENNYNQELSKNGFYSLFSAFRNNELDYYEFYKTEKNSKVLANYRTLLTSKKSKFIDKSFKNEWREIKDKKQEKKYNVMLVMIESLSAEFMGAYGDKRVLTPHMDALTKESLFFSNFFATGTRTVRGMEAVTMSVPPTAGRSIIKRPDNHNIFGMGWVFKEKGYDNKFIYAGHGYFDNMNEYFSGNGFNIVDRVSFSEDETSFSNVWGVCDEDLFEKSIKEADKSYAKHQPFFSFVMTTSNHRPFTYPNGKVNIPSHTGREGGVKYTDYAINKFLKDASKKPWFKETLFVFVADHNAGSAGKNELPLYRYKIPFMVYAPSLVVPKKVSKLSSQIDLAPTLFSLMHWSYKSKFYGQDILASDFHERALVGNYQKLGLYADNHLTILLPNKTIKEYLVKKLTLTDTLYEEIMPTKKEIDEVIAYYQSESYFYMNHLDRK